MSLRMSQIRQVAGLLSLQRLLEQLYADVSTSFNLLNVTSCKIVNLA